MRCLVIILAGMTMLTSTGSESVGVSTDNAIADVDTVTVSLDSVTVSESQVAAKTVQLLSGRDLVSCAREGRTVESRLEALSRITDQDDLFYLVFKPGIDRNVSVRIAAVKRIADLELLRFLAAKCPIAEVRDVAMDRVKSVYGDQLPLPLTYNASVVRGYVSRLRQRTECE